MIFENKVAVVTGGGSGIDSSYLKSAERAFLPLVISTTIR